MRLLLFLPLLAAACDRTPASAQPKAGDKPQDAAAAAAVPVRLGDVAERTVDRRIEISGSLMSPEDSTIAAEVEGKVVALKADLGDRVGSGALLARIAPEEYRLRMEQAEAQRELAEANLKRTGQLAKSEMVAQKELDDARFAAAQARATADLARKKHGDTTVRAPFAGAIAKRLVSMGEYVKPGQPLFDLVILDPLVLTGEVPERYLAAVKPGAPVTVRVDAFAGRAFEGKVSRIAPAVNPQSRAFTVEARIGNRGGTLKPGVFAHAELLVGQAERTIVVPEAAVVTFAGVTKVFVIAGDVAHERQVELDRRLPGGLVAVRGGDLTPGDKVAVAGAAKLAHGTPVTVRTAPPEAKP